MAGRTGEVSAGQRREVRRDRSVHLKENREFFLFNCAFRSPIPLSGSEDVGYTYRRVGAYERAIGFLQRSVAVRKQHLGTDHPETLTSMSSLALAYQDAGKLDLALPLHKETLKLRKAKLSPDHPDTVGTMASLESTSALSLRYARMLFSSARRTPKTRLPQRVFVTKKAVMVVYNFSVAASPH